MAENLKVASLAKWALATLLSFVSVAYLKRKLDVFWEQCSPSESEQALQVRWRRVTGLWTLVVSSLLQWSRDTAHHDNDDPTTSWESQAASPPPPSCQMSVAEIVKHIVFTSIPSDLHHVSSAASAFVADLGSLLLDTFGRRVTAGRAAFHNFVEVAAMNLAEAMWGGFDTLAQTSWGGFDAVWAFVGVAVCVLAVLIPVLLCMYRRKCSRLPHRSMSASGNSFPMMSSSTGFASTPSRSAVAVHKYSSSPVPRYDPDSSLDEIEKDGERQGRVGGERRMVVWWWWWVVFPALLLLSLSIPWEFCRLYQRALANKAAVASAGPPLGCSPKRLSLLQTLTLWLSRQLAWGHEDLCDRYYQATFVDPVWEVTPLMVLTSVMSRCVVHPVETLSSGVGGAVRHFMSHVPLHWQPVMVALGTSFLFIVLLLSCRYRLSVPWLFKIEPRTPVLSQKTTRGAKVPCDCEQESGGVECSASLAVTDSDLLSSPPPPTPPLLQDTGCSQRPLRAAEDGFISLVPLIPQHHSYSRLHKKHVPGDLARAGSVHVAGVPFSGNDHGCYPGDSSDDCDEEDEKKNFYRDRRQENVYTNRTHENVYTNNTPQRDEATAGRKLRCPPAHGSQRSMSLDRPAKTVRRGQGTRNWSSDRGTQYPSVSAMHHVDPDPHTSCAFSGSVSVPSKPLKGKPLKKTDTGNSSSGRQRKKTSAQLK